MSAQLDFPPIDETARVALVAKPESIDLAKVDLTEVALAQFGDWRIDVAAAKKKLTGLVLDLATQSKVDEAKSLRQRTVNTPIAEIRKVSKALTDALGEATGYRSPFAAKLKEQLTEALPHGLGIDDVAKFQHLLNAAVTSVVHGANQDAIQAAVSKIASEALPDVPHRIKMSELLSAAREGFHKESHEAFYAYFEPSDFGGGGHLYLDSSERPGGAGRDREGRKYNAEFRLSFNSDGEVYALKFDGKDMTANSRPSVISRFEGLLLSMYTGRTTIEIDMDDGDVSAAASEQYE
jgi:hypothetical protein